MDTSYQILLIHSLFTWVVIGMIWLIQVVYYPLSKALGDLYQKYEHEQLRYLGFLLVPIYLGEVGTGIALVCIKTAQGDHFLAVLNLVLIGLIYSSALFLRRKKTQIRDLFFIRRLHAILFNTNWFRTILWGIRGFVVYVLLIQGYK